MRSRSTTPVENNNPVTGDCKSSRRDNIGSTQPDFAINRFKACAEYRLPYSLLDIQAITPVNTNSLARKPWQKRKLDRSDQDTSVTRAIHALVQD
jgi:hypothetical protein